MGQAYQPNADDVTNAVKIAVDSLKENTKEAEIAFFGGSFTAIDRKYMTDRDISLLNEYHSEVYKRISPYLDEDEKAWLREKTMPR